MDPPRVTVPELARLLADPDPPLVLDVRTPNHYAAGHVPGSRNASTGHTDEAMAGVPRDRLIITYCDMDRRARASQRYRSERVASLIAG